MGSPVSPIVANVYMEDLEQNIIATAPEDCQPRSWKRCVDDIICLVHTGKAEQLQQRMNTTDCTGSIVFIRDDGENNGMPFLDAKFTKKEDGCVKSTVYRKKTRTRTLCPTNSKHQKPGVVMNRSETTTTEEGDKKEEMEHLRGGGQEGRDGTPERSLKSAWLSILGLQKGDRQHKTDEKDRQWDQEQRLQESSGYPTCGGSLGKRTLTLTLHRLMKKYGVATAMLYTTLRSLFVHPKDKVASAEQGELVYQIPGKNCGVEYIVDWETTEHTTG